MSATPTRSHWVERATRASRIGVAVAGVLLAVLMALPWFADRATMRLGVEICCYLTLAQMWNLLAGYAGLVSIGQQAFVGIGGYALFAPCALLGLHPLLALPLAGLAAGLLAVPTAFVVFRLRGPYFAIGTWVAAEVFRLTIAQISLLGGGSGMSLPAAIVKMISPVPATRDTIVYFCGLALACAAIAMVYTLLRSRTGLALTAIRDNERAAGSLGVDSDRLKLAIYIGVASVTGLTGGLLFLEKLRISPDAAFSVNDWTTFVIFITVIGGIGRIEGPIVGTAIFFILRGLLADLGAAYLIILGAVAVVTMLVAPRGLWGTLADRTGVQIFPVQRRLRLIGE